MLIRRTPATIYSSPLCYHANNNTSHISGSKFFLLVIISIFLIFTYSFIGSLVQLSELLQSSPKPPAVPPKKSITEIPLQVKNRNFVAKSDRALKTKTAQVLSHIQFLQCLIPCSPECTTHHDDGRTLPGDSSRLD